MTDEIAKLNVGFRIVLRDEEQGNCGVGWPVRVQRFGGGDKCPRELAGDETYSVAVR
jgi:hypothetical protein